MRKINILLILFLVFISAYGQVNKKINKEYTGTYKSKDFKGCPISLIITSGSDGYHYKIKIKTREKEGRLKILKEGSDVYLSFVGLIGKKPKKEVEGQINGNSIVIQNYGNTMNEYLVFSECNNTKYIELSKIISN